jgi:VIT1/CCC1 family predicted Fe2+/Mn2+ transporter
MTCAECDNSVLPNDYLCRDHRLSTASWWYKPIARFTLQKENGLLAEVRNEVKEHVKSPLARLFFYVTGVFILLSILAFASSLWLTWKLAILALISLLSAGASFGLFVLFEDEFK